MITDAIDRAYELMETRNWDTIYWAIDLHGVCLESNYTTGEHNFISNDVINVLRLISFLPESKIILWSSMHDEGKAEVVKLFQLNGIKVFAFNQNPAEANTKTGCFDQKFYFSILLDDKAGFNPERDWPIIGEHLMETRYESFFGPKI